MAGETPRHISSDVGLLIRPAAEGKKEAEGFGEPKEATDLLVLDIPAPAKREEGLKFSDLYNRRLLARDLRP